MGVVVDDVIFKVQSSITDGQSNVLMEEINPEEVKAALFSMNPDKAPGIDGFTPGFYQKCWPIIGKDAVLTVKKFFAEGSFRKI